MIALRERLELAYNIVSELTLMKPIDPKLLYDLQLHLNIAIGLLPTEVHAVQDDSCSWYIIPRPAFLSENGTTLKRHDTKKNSRQHPIRTFKHRF